MEHRRIKASDKPEQWNGAYEYLMGAKCIHKGFIWEASYCSIYNHTFEPGGFQPSFYWERKEAIAE